MFELSLSQEVQYYGGQLARARGFSSFLPNGKNSQANSSQFTFHEHAQSLAHTYGRTGPIANPQVHEPVATEVQEPSGFCTLVVPCQGFLPEGHTGLPDSKVGTSRGVGRKGRTNALEGFIVGLMSKILNAIL